MDFTKELGISSHEFRIVIGRTRIEYDPDKEEINRRKHHYSLESAVHLLERFAFPFGVKVPSIWTDPFTENGEVRYMFVSVDDAGKIVLMIFTMRPDEAIRIISFRRASEAERKLFQELTGYVEP